MGGLAGGVEVGLMREAMGPIGPRCMLKWIAGSSEGDGFRGGRLCGGEQGGEE